MSLGMLIKAPEGIVLAAESRVTLTSQLPNQPPIHVNYDNATKLFGFGGNDYHSHIGVVTYGQSSIGLRTAHSFLPEFEASLPKERIKVTKFAELMSKFYDSQWKAGMPDDYKGINMTFLVGGFDIDKPYGKIYEIKIPNVLKPKAHHVKEDEFGITWGGQREIVDRLIQGFDSNLPQRLITELKLNKKQQEDLRGIMGQMTMQIPIQALPLQDCIDLALFFVRTTIMAQNLTVGIRGCGGFTDLAIIRRREGFQFIQQKKLKGETAN